MAHKKLQRLFAHLSDLSGLSQRGERGERDGQGGQFGQFRQRGQLNLVVQALWGLAFVGLYVLLDWASYITPLRHLNVTPWNPAPALGLIYIIRRGKLAILLLLIAILISEVIVRGSPESSLMTLSLGATVTLSYMLIANLLKHHFPEGGLFSDRRGLLIWSSIILLGSLASSLAFISQLLLAELITREESTAAILHFWIGDSVGIFVTLPLLWWLQDSPRRHLFRQSLMRWETLAYTLFALLVLWFAFIPGAHANYRYFYVLFLPIVWAASRQGLTGAIFCTALMQIGMMIFGLLQPAYEVSLFELQMRTFLLALVSFLIGTSVDEQRRVASELRQSLRLAAAGEMAGALAHELNQPLTALAAYGSACQQLLTHNPNDPRLHDTLHKMIAESERAALVMRRLRDFFRTGATQLEYFQLQSLIETSSAPFIEKSRHTGIDFHLADIPQALIHGDRLQLEVVLRNLLANAFDAVSLSSDVSAIRQVCLNLTIEDESRVVIEVTDTGSGPMHLSADQMFEPYVSSKSSGMGLGLAISRAIAEAHGGSLYAHLVGYGCFHLTLPIEVHQGRTPHGQYRFHH